MGRPRDLGIFTLLILFCLAEGSAFDGDYEEDTYILYFEEILFTDVPPLPDGMPVKLKFSPVIRARSEGGVAEGARLQYRVTGDFTFVDQVQDGNEFVMCNRSEGLRMIETVMSWL